MGVNLVAQMIRDVLWEILSDGQPGGFAVLNFFKKLLFPHAERAGKNPDGVGKMFSNEDVRRFLSEQIPAQDVDPAALLGGI